MANISVAERIRREENGEMKPRKGFEAMEVGIGWSGPDCVSKLERKALEMVKMGVCGDRGEMRCEPRIFGRLEGVCAALAVIRGTSAKNEISRILRIAAETTVGEGISA